MIELEKKMLLTKEEYDYLLEHFAKDAPMKEKPIVKQVNYYFDTKDLSMNRKNITCRIRLKDHKYKGTMKRHSEKPDHSTEISVEVRNGIFDNGFLDMGLTLQGALATDRCVIIKDAHCEAVLDKNRYLDCEDYELEIEYAPEHETEAMSILRIVKDMLPGRQGLPAYRDSFSEQPNIPIPSKSSRFFERRATMEKSKNIAHIPHTPVGSSDDFIHDYPEDESDETDSDDQNPDKYCHASFSPSEYGKNVCVSCIHRNGTTCDSEHGTCEYEHYPPVQ